MDLQNALAGMDQQQLMQLLSKSYVLYFLLSLIKRLYFSDLMGSGSGSGGGGGGSSSGFGGFQDVAPSTASTRRVSPPAAAAIPTP